MDKKFGGMALKLIVCESDLQFNYQFHVSCKSRTELLQMISDILMHINFIAVHSYLKITGTSLYI